MAFGVIIPALVLGLVVWGIIALIRRGTAKRPQGADDGADVLLYLLMAVAVGVFAFSLVTLGRAAFPGGTFVFEPERQVASSLAGIVVSGPIAFFLWRRQRERRTLHPTAAGWTVYLSLIEGVFMTSFVVTAFAVLDWLLSDGAQQPITDVLVFGAVVVFHELAVRATPPGSDAAELPRVIGSAIGLVTLVIGIGGLLEWGLSDLYQRMAPGSTSSGMEPLTAVALILTGAPVWWHRWLRPWPAAPTAPRNAWTFLMATAGLATLLGAVTFTTAQTLAYLLTGEGLEAGRHFDFLPITLAVGVVAGLVWVHHRRLLGKERTDPVRSHEYSTTGIALATGVGATTTLVSAVASSSTFVGSTGTVAITAGVTLLVAFLTWMRFWGRAQAAPRELEATTAPRRFYLLGLGVVMALVGAGSLIATLVFVFQAALGVEDLDDSFVPVVTLAVTAGAASWHLLRTYAADRELTASHEVVTPFDVTVICSHPGMLAARFPKEARIRVMYRSDGQGVVTDEMADSIVAAVSAQSSLVWVDDTGFRVAPAR